VTAADEATDHPMTATDLSLLSLLLQQMTLMEGRIVRQMTESSDAAKVRWKAHDEQHDEWEKALRALSHRLDDHLKKEEENDLIFDARVQPVKRLGLWFTREWRTVAIVVLLVSDFVWQFLSNFGHVGG
jgi:hypothetical protein